MMLLDDLKPNNVELLLNLCYKQIGKGKELMSYFKNTPSDVSASIFGWLEILDSYYRAVTGYGVFCLNCFMQDRLVEKTKGYETTVVENNLLGNAVLDEKDKLMALAKKNSQDTQLVIIAQHSLSFYNEKMERRLKEAITKFDAIKDQLDKKTYIGITLDSVLTTSFKVIDEDKIEAQLLRESGLVAADN
jgi:hypothetical protein